MPPLGEDTRVRVKPIRDVSRLSLPIKYYEKY